MAVIKIREFGTSKELEDFLNGVLISKPLDASKKYDVRGLTLTFTTPAVTITFPSTAAFADASLHEIVKEINNQSAGRARMRMYGQGQAGKTAHVALSNDGDVFTGGTAAALLGLTAGTVGAAKIVQANVLQIFSNPQSNTYGVAYTA